MRTRILAPALGATVALLVGPGTALADHPPIQDPSFFETVFAPTVQALPPWLVLGLLPALILVLLGTAAFWAWRNAAMSDEAGGEDA